jgi:hypothetical protein
MNSVANLLPILEKDYPDIKFIPGKTFAWSPRKGVIMYTSHQANSDHGVWALLHEVAHATLKHKDCNNDFDLLKLERTTWEQACEIGKKYGISIDNEHIQDCLDTYRDWLHDRASCPNCKVVSLQRQDGLYKCFNCKTAWQVSNSRRSLITRKTIIENK